MADAHEFLNYLLNTIDELLQREMKEAEDRSPSAASTQTGRDPPRSAFPPPPQLLDWQPRQMGVLVGSSTPVGPPNSSPGYSSG